MKSENVTAVNQKEIMAYYLHTIHIKIWKYHKISEITSKNSSNFVEKCNIMVSHSYNDRR